MIRTLRYRKVRAGPGEELDQHKENSSTHPTIETYKIGPIMAKKVLHRTAALTAAFGIAIAAGGYGAPAFAQQDLTTTTPSITQQIPADATGTLTITKFLNNTTGDQADGQPTDTAGMGTPLQGVTYSVQRVNADVTTNAGLADAATLTPDSAKQKLDDGFTSRTATTGTGGVATFENLLVGVYLVTESKVPNGVVPSEPFLVFMPMTNPDGTGWNYNVHAYPKNTETTVTKKVEDADKNVGDNITYTITSDIPALANDTATISKYQVTDNLDESMLTTTAGQITVELEGTGLTVTLASEDYTITVNEATQEVLVNFETSGREKLTQAKKDDPNAKVVTSITAAVGAIGGGTGIVTNDAQTITNNGAGSGDTTTTSDSVKSMWGKVNINKKGPDAEGNEVALAGAVFSVYRCGAGSDLQGEALTIGGATDSDTTKPGTQYTTDAEGTVTIDGLHVTDFEDGAALAAEAQNYYCLVEEDAPDGYAALREPIQFQLHEGAEDVTRDATAGNIVYTANVTNYQDNRLPGTGGMGVILLLLAGAGVGLAAIKLTKKKPNRA